jgi:hypothetical protein
MPRKRNDTPEIKLGRAQIELHRTTVRLREFVDRFEGLTLAIFGKPPVAKKKKIRKRR